MMPVLIAYGYARDDLEDLVEDCVGLVCRSERVGLLLMCSCRVLVLPSIKGCLQFTLRRSDEDIDQMEEKEELWDTGIGHGQ